MKKEKGQNQTSKVMKITIPGADLREIRERKKEGGKEGGK